MTKISRRKSKLPPKGQRPAEWPAHDYWMYDEKGEFIHKFAFTLIDHPDHEYLEDTDYEAEWAQVFYWSPIEAAALSFGRSPNKVRWETYEEEMYGSSEFVTYFGDLRDSILEAQGAGALPKPLLAVVYVQWAELSGVPIPPGLADKVKSWFARVMAITNETALSIMSVDDPAPADRGLRAGQPEREKVPRPSGRKEGNLLGLIYALAWYHHKLGEHPVGTVATNIEKIVVRLSEVMPKFQIEAKKQTISDWLTKAIEEREMPPPKSDF